MCSFDLVLLRVYKPKVCQTRMPKFCQNCISSFCSSLGALPSWRLLEGSDFIGKMKRAAVAEFAAALRPISESYVYKITLRKSLLIQSAFRFFFNAIPIIFHGITRFWRASEAFACSEWIENAARLRRFVFEFLQLFVETFAILRRHF